MTTKQVLYRREGRIAYITLNRPEKLNACTDDVVRGLIATMHHFDADDEAWIAILHGEGRAFCSGADVVQRQNRTPEEFRRIGGPEGPGAKSADVLSRQVHWKPVIAAVHGYTLGLAVMWAFQSEFLVAAAGTQFQLTETRRGLSSLALVELMRHRGRGSFADEVGLTGRFFTAEEAHEAGMVDRLADTGRHVEVAEELAEEVLVCAPLSVRSIVRRRRRELDRRLRSATYEVDNLQLYLTEDFRESAEAFAEKRPAKPFVGR